MHVTKFLTYTIGIDVAPIKAYKNQFGSGVLTNVTGMNCKDVFAPHIDFCNTNFLMVITDAEERPVVENGQ